MLWDFTLEQCRSPLVLKTPCPQAAKELIKKMKKDQKKALEDRVILKHATELSD